MDKLCLHSKFGGHPQLHGGETQKRLEIFVCLSFCLFVTLGPDGNPYRIYSCNKTIYVFEQRMGCSSAPIYTVSQKNISTYFCSLSVKYEPISIKIGRHVLEETLDKTEHVYQFLLKSFDRHRAKNKLACFC